MTPRRSPLAAGLLALLLAAPVYAIPGRENKDDLSRAAAEFRRAQIESVAYDLHFTLREKAETFDGVAELTVVLKQTGAPLSIDLKAETLREVSVNGVPVHNLVKRDGSFDIPAEHLSAGPMTVSVEYTGRYSNSRDGLCRYTDPVDDQEYLHTNLEPYAAHYVFPCFDQPDIKATYTLAVTAPSTWTIIGNMPLASTATAGANRTAELKTTPPISTYLFFLGAGAYQVWRDEHRGLPLALYARASLAEYFDPERLFAETKAGLDYFNGYFQTPYPFDKYDHVFAPELGPGAMENPGAVTMNEYMIFRGAPTTEDYRGRNNTLLHEMAHMWFGDLVTMAWWNDLWLNESFATFSAYQAQDAIGAYSGIWQDFYQSKGWAYSQDQLSTTHPVEVDVPSAQLAIANFDGITYSKGASALKQLWFTVGADAYRRGVARYFGQYAWQNATRGQFMDAISAETAVNLDTWTQRWLQSEGLSSMAVTYTCGGGAIDGFTLTQSPVNAQSLSPHTTQIALYKFNDLGRLAPYEVVSVKYEADATPLDALSGKPCPDFVYPNHGDMDYGLFYLDPRSFETALKHLSALEEPFTRLMVWGTLYDMVRHQKLRASEFMDLVLNNLPTEPDTGMLEYLLGNRPTREVFHRFLAPERTLAYAPALSTLLWNGLQSAPGGTDARLLWLDAYVGTASRSEDLEHLRGLLDPGLAFPLDQPRRWQVVGKLAWLGAADTEALLETELERDPTDQGNRYAFGIRGALPTFQAKKAQWERLKDPALSLSLLRSGAWTFHNPLHPELSEAFVDDWFDYVLSRDWDAEQHRISVWFDELMPPVYTPEYLQRSRKALAGARLPIRARRAWQESNDHIERIIAIRAFDAAPTGAGG